MTTQLSRRSLLHCGAAAAVTVAGAPLLGAAAAHAAGKRRFPGDPGPGKLYYGASSQQNVSDWEADMGQVLALHRTYHKPRQIGGMIRTARVDLDTGRMPHLSMKPPGRWAGVAAGREDAWLRDISRGLARLDQPLFLTFHHEPENDAKRRGTARDFVAMQKHIIAHFAQRAPKVTIVPVLQGWSFSPYNRKAHPERWYVPTAKVYGVDIYNPFSTKRDQWVTFATKLDEVRKYTHGKPIAIGEYGCRNDPDNPGRAAAWMADAFAYAQRHDIVSMSYFNSARHSPDGTWALDGQRAEVFESNLASAVVARPA